MTKEDVDELISKIANYVLLSPPERINLHGQQKNEATIVILEIIRRNCKNLRSVKDFFGN